MITAILAGAVITAPAIKYPMTKIVNQIDLYHGVAVADPYRWLEQPVSVPEVRDWVTAENKVTFDYLDKIPGRDRLNKELGRRINFERFGTPSQHGDVTIYSRNSGLQNQDVIYVVDRKGAEPRVLLDPNTLSKDGTVALNGMDVSDDGKTLLYGLSKAGSDWVEWRVRDIATGNDKPDVVKHSKFGVGMLNADSSGIYYLRFPEVKEGEAFTAANTQPRIYYHELGTEQSADELIYELNEHPDWFVWPGLDESRKFMYLYVNDPSVPNNILWGIDLENRDRGVQQLFSENDANYNPVFRRGSEHFIWTTKDAPTGKIMVIDTVRRIAPRTIIEATKDTIESVSVVNNKIIVRVMKDAKSAIKIYELNGEFVEEVKLPGLGAVDGFAGKSTDSDTYYSYADFTTPSVIYHYDFANKKSTEFRKPQLSFDTSKYEAKQVFYKSKDGTQVPMFIVHKKGIKLDGSNPTLLYGYGGFNVSNTPWFSTSRTVWMDMGGVWCLANIRGGGEYGKDWHHAALKTKRQNAYDDFIAAAEYLIDSKYCTPKTLAIQGGSNGGLLVGACMTQRPELFGVAIPEVGVMDMLRFNKFTIGAAWEADYGSPENLEEFFALYRISPYHNLRANTVYPATLVTTADTDDRVVPAHSFKFAARLQAAHVGDAPVLIRIETDAGHGAGKPMTKVLEEVTDIYAFILQNTGKKIPAKF